jgi:transglutaminase-like putative cysteine protease
MLAETTAHGDDRDRRGARGPSGGSRRNRPAEEWKMNTEVPADAGASPADLAPTTFLDADHADVIGWAQEVTADSSDDRARAVALFHAVRDGWRYDPYETSRDPAEYRASAILATTSSWCVPKSVLLGAGLRAVGVPSRLGFADVRNHLTSEKLTAHMGTDLFVYHGYVSVYLDGEWRKVSSAFNIELCERFGTKVLEWDGTHDALMHPFDTGGRRHMEYVRDRGVHCDLPLEDIFACFDEVYGPSITTGRERVDDDDAFHD